jgi:hypothetical protein
MFQKLVYIIELLMLLFLSCFISFLIILLYHIVGKCNFTYSFFIAHIVSYSQVVLLHGHP